MAKDKKKPADLFNIVKTPMRKPRKKKDKDAAVIIKTTVEVVSTEPDEPAALPTYTEAQIWEDKKRALIEDLQEDRVTLSFSSLSAFATSPRAFINYKLAKGKATDAMQMGKVVHCLVLEPEEFKDRYAVGPECDLGTNKGKALFREFLTPFLGIDFDWTVKADLIERVYLSAKLEVITGKVFAEARMRADAILNNRAARRIMDQIGETEIAATWDYNGFKMRGFIDGEGDSCRVDLKNYPSAEIRPIERDLIWGDYKVQAYCYQEARGAKPYYIIAVDGNGEVSVHGLSTKLIAEGGDRLKYLTDHFRRCVNESMLFPEVWDESQDFWLYNSGGINYL